MIFPLNNKKIVYLSSFFLLISLAIWCKYLFFYNPYEGAFILLWTLPVSWIGIIFSFYIKDFRLRLGLILLHLLLSISFFFPLVLWAIFGA